MSKKKYDPDYYNKYYHANKEKMHDRLYKKVKCECGAIITACNIYHHRKTKNIVIICF
jgi:hypothetical protein